MILSCSKDSEDEPEEITYSNFKLEYTVNITQDLIDYANVSINYFDADGNKQEESVTSTQWTKSFNITRSPIKAGFSLNVERNSTPITKDSFDGMVRVSGEIKYKRNTTEESASVLSSSFGNSSAGIDQGKEETICSTIIERVNGHSQASQSSFSTKKGVIETVTIDF